MPVPGPYFSSLVAFIPLYPHPQPPPKLASEAAPLAPPIQAAPAALASSVFLHSTAPALPTKAAMEAKKEATHHHHQQQPTMTPSNHAGSDPMAVLPIEVGFEVLSLLDPPSLARAASVSKHWRNLTSSDEVWRKVSVRMAYALSRHHSVADALREPLHSAEPSPQVSIPSDVPLNLSSCTASGLFDSVTTFRELCAHRWSLDRSWCHPSASTSSSSRRGSAEGAAPSPPEPGYEDVRPPQPKALPLKPVMRNIDAAPASSEESLDGQGDQGGDVWRIKIDPLDRTIISTGQGGGVRVVDLDTGECLWRIPSELTRNFPHLEYDRGWMIFDRIGLGHFEVWKAERLFTDEELGPGRQRRRGVFHQFDLINSPRAIRAYRFQFPTLAAATQDSHILLFDVPTRQLILDINVGDTLHANSNVNYIDFDDDFVYLVGIGAKALTVFSRALGRRIWSLADHFEAGWPRPRTWTPGRPGRSLEGPEYASLTQRPLVTASPGQWQFVARQNMAQLTMNPIQSWNAVHPDKRTGSLCVLGQHNVLVVRSYRKLFKAWEAQAGEDSSAAAPPPPDDVADVEMDDVVLVRDSWEEVGRGQIWDDKPTGQLTVSDGRAFVVLEDTPYLLDLDPERISPDADRPNPAMSIYSNILPSQFNPSAGSRFSSSLFGCSCVQMDATTIYAVEHHETLSRSSSGTSSAGSTSPVPSHSSPSIHGISGLSHRALLQADFSDVLCWDFAEAAKKRLG